MTPASIITIIAAYFAVVLIISWFTGKKSDNSGFFTGNRRQSWYVVAFAMIGSAMSGVTFVSVPGMVGVSAFGYMQMALGFIVGQLVIAFVLVPLFYRMKLISIYGYLEDRFGLSSYRTGALFFFISKILGASVRLYLVCIALQVMVFAPLGIHFSINVAITVSVLLLYTFRGGVKSVIWIDFLKTACMLAAIILSIFFICRSLGMDFTGMYKAVSESDMSRIFFFDDPKNPQFFFKQFFGGIFTLIAMTGLDQDMMQRTLSCRNIKDAQKNIIVSSLLQTIVIFMFLILGVLLYIFAGQHEGLADYSGDSIFPAVATSGLLPWPAGILFVIGLISCSYAAGGSALTALTTSFTLDILDKPGNDEAGTKAIRERVHIAMAIVMGLLIILFNMASNTSAIDAVYKLASYTYGPILGMFSFGILTRRKVMDNAVPAIAVISPLVCLLLQLNSERWFDGYKISYELLILNALMTFMGLLIFSRRHNIDNQECQSPVNEQNH